MSIKSGEWKVYFDGNFYGHGARSRAGTELPIGAHFHWADRDWFIPSAYACGKGLVVDFCMRVEQGNMRAFLDKWNIRKIEDEAFIPEEMREQFALENPLMFHFLPQLLVNGKELLPERGCSFAYISDFPAALDEETAQVMAHYALDQNACWVVSRSCYAWKTARRPRIKTLSVTMTQQPENVPGARFTLQKAGDRFSFIRPATGARHTITALELTRQTLDFPCDAQEYPTHCLVMRYRVTPPLPRQVLIVQDTSPSDRPRNIEPDGAASAGIIGGSDGSTALVFGLDAGEGAAVSSLHDQPVDSVTWRLSFLETRYAPQTFPLL